MTTWCRGARWAFHGGARFARTSSKSSSNRFAKLFGDNSCSKLVRRQFYSTERTLARMSLLPTIQAATFTSASGYFSTELTSSESLIEAQLLEDEILTNMIVTVQQPVLAFWSHWQRQHIIDLYSYCFYFLIINMLQQWVSSWVMSWFTVISDQVQQCRFYSNSCKLTWNVAFYIRVIKGKKIDQAWQSTCIIYSWTPLWYAGNRTEGMMHDHINFWCACSQLVAKVSDVLLV